MRVETIGRCDGDGGRDTAMQQLSRCRLSDPRKEIGAEAQPGLSCFYLPGRAKKKRKKKRKV